jgi:hypothetical protein
VLNLYILLIFYFILFIFLYFFLVNFIPFDCIKNTKKLYFDYKNNKLMESKTKENKAENSFFNFLNITVRIK